MAERVACHVGRTGAVTSLYYIYVLTLFARPIDGLRVAKEIQTY